MWFINVVFLTVLILFPIASWATTYTAVSCSFADVTTALNAAKTGDIVAIPNGNCSWSSPLTIAKGITLRGAGIDSTIITNIGTESLIDVNLSSNVPIRITGIYFDNVSTITTRNAIDVNGKLDGSFALTKLRIDHNTFKKGKRAVHVRGWVYGVIDNNNFLNCDIGVGISGDDNYSWMRAIAAGTADALFIETNTFTINNDTDREPNEQVYHQGGGRTVTRYNTFDGTSYTVGNSLFFDSHGNNNYYTGTSSDFRGQPILEIYMNTFKAHKTYSMLYFRGGSLLVWNNALSITTGTTQKMILTEEESWQLLVFPTLATVWPAEDQINNSFFWNNTFNGSPIGVQLKNVSDTTFIQENRDYFLHAPQSTGGKSIYVGRAGGAMTFSSVVANAYYPYTPYAYPHPLTTIPAAPQNLQNN